MSRADFQQRLAERALHALTGRGECRLRRSEQEARQHIVTVLKAGDEELRQLDLEAERLFSAHKSQLPPGSDHQRALAMIRRRLAEQKGIVL
ncbi:MAG: hypothetical protein C0616_02400 [Desulfuromonas sp.]|nr:MAG: hypothetical protein C0616_02400 [Desulfuromonas sp.]